MHIYHDALLCPKQQDQPESETSRLWAQTYLFSSNADLLQYLVEKQKAGYPGGCDRQRMLEAEAYGHGATRFLKQALGTAKSSI